MGWYLDRELSTCDEAELVELLHMARFLNSSMHEWEDEDARSWSFLRHAKILAEIARRQQQGALF
jgi:hypothetical protein